jgi:hypothetical protein
VNLWESLVLSVAGGALALIGTWVGVRLQARDQKKIRAEQAERDNLLRLHSERVSAYAAFYREALDMRHGLSHVFHFPDSPEWKKYTSTHKKNLSDAYTLVLLIGTQKAATAAQSLTHYTDDAFFKQVDFSQQHFSELLWTFILHARASLVFPDQPDVP